MTNLTRGPYRFSLELATDIRGPVEYEIFDGSVDKFNWIEFLWTDLYDVVNEYPGPRSILFADNHRIHKNDEFEEFIHETGMVSIWLPAYLPFTNLAEWVFDGIRMVQQQHDDAKGYEEALLLLHDAVEAMKGKKWSIAADEIKSDTLCSD